MTTRRTDTHLRIMEVMGDKIMQEDELALMLGKPAHGIRAALRGMVVRGEATVIKPKVRVATGTPFKYKLKGKQR